MIYLNLPQAWDSEMIKHIYLQLSQTVSEYFNNMSSFKDSNIEKEVKSISDEIKSGAKSISNLENELKSSAKTLENEIRSGIKSISNIEYEIKQGIKSGIREALEDVIDEI